MGVVDGGYRTVGFGEKTVNAWKGCCFAIFLGFPCLIWLTFQNELAYVINEATADLVSTSVNVKQCIPSSALDGKLIYTSCELELPDLQPQMSPVLKPFYKDFHAAEMSWTVEIYQYEETESVHTSKNNDGSSTEHKEYHYDKGWHSHSIDSKEFHDTSFDNENTEMPANIHDESIAASDHSVLAHQPDATPRSVADEYALPTSLVNQLPSKSAKPTVRQDFRGGWGFRGTLGFDDLHESHGGYLVTYSGSPRIGDLRIYVSGKSSKHASFAARQQPWKQSGATVDAYPPQKFDFWGRKTKPLERLEAGMMSRGEFIKRYHNENMVVCYVIRIVTFIGIIVMCCAVVSPLAVMTDLLRMVNIFTCGLGTLLDDAATFVIRSVACGFGCACWLVVVAFSWLFVHPTLSIVLFALAAFGFQGIPRLVRQHQDQKAANAREVGYVKLGDVAFDCRKVQPVPNQVLMTV